MVRSASPPSLARAPWLKEVRLQEVMRAISEAGGEARVAGGAVRNALMGEAVTEIDLATTLAPEEVTDALSRRGMAVHPTGIDHGTVTVAHRHAVFEITTLRRDVETDGRRAVVAYSKNWIEDALRRDFTMNALYADGDGKIYDFTNGYADIVKRKVKFVGSPSARIREDYLRILRFFRFHARYGHGAPDAAGLRACIQLKRGLTKLSAERVRQELFKLLAAKNAVATLKIMARHSILRAILPHTDEWRVISRLPPDGMLRLAVLSSQSLALKDRLRLSNDEAARLEALHGVPQLSPALRPSERRRMLFQLGARTWKDAVHLSHARSRAPMGDRKWRAMLSLPDRWPIPELPVKGRDLLAAGFAPGPELGEALKRLEDWWIASDFKPGKDDLLARALKTRG